MKKPILKSFLLHGSIAAMLLLVWMIRLKSPKKTDAVIQVQLMDVHVHHTSTQTRPESSRQTTLHEASSNHESSANTSSEPEQPSWAGVSNEAKSQYLQEIMRLISSRQFYPRAAILNELQGTVKLRVALDETGLMTECVVTESSGHKILDEAAVQTLQKISRFSLPTPGLKGVVLLIPIRYEINPVH